MGDADKIVAATFAVPNPVVENSPWVTTAYRLVAFIGTYP
jgi:hypothetical protein